MTIPKAADWAESRNDYECGAYDLQEISELLNVKLETVKKRAEKEKWRRSDNDRTVRKLKAHRVHMLNAICNSTMEGLRKADDLLVECDNLKDVEVHSKTIKNYKDICIGKTPEEVLESLSGKTPGLDELNAELEHLSQEDVNQILSSS